MSNTPVTGIGRTAFRYSGRPGVSWKWFVAAGNIVAAEMHQQPGDRSCKNEYIGGTHYGPVTVYLSKVADAAAADGSAGLFKILQDGSSSVCTNEPLQTIIGLTYGFCRKYARPSGLETTIIGARIT
jgi:hypothetical protein